MGVKISDLINHLQLLKSLNGDVPVVVRNECGRFSSVRFNSGEDDPFLMVSLGPSSYEDFDYSSNTASSDKILCLAIEDFYQ